MSRTDAIVKPTVQLHCGDCLDLLKTLDAGSIDAVVTDPPYGMKHKRSGNSKNSISTTGKVFTESIVGDDKLFDPSPWLGFSLVAFSGPQWFYDRLPAGGSWHCWNKRGDYKPLDQADADFVWLSKRAPSRVLNLAWRGLCRHSENQNKIEHPTQKAVAFMDWILGLLKLQPGMTVFDPYMGSGTTGVACVRAGINFIGCEIDEAYFRVARRRIRDAEFTLF